MTLRRRRIAFIKDYASIMNHVIEAQHERSHADIRSARRQKDCLPGYTGFERSSLATSTPSNNFLFMAHLAGLKLLQHFMGWV
jgi:hypothetical protein